MKRSIYIYNEGVLQRHDNTLRFINTNDERKDIPIENVSDIYVMSELSINVSLLNILSKYGITVHFFNYYSFYIGSYYPKETLLSGQLLVNQVEHYVNDNKRLEIAKKFIDGAADNIYRNLRYYNGRGKDVSSYMSEIEIIKKICTRK